MKIELTENEIKILTQLLDISLKTGGLQVLEGVNIIINKITNNK